MSAKHEVSAEFKKAMNDLGLHYHEVLYDAIVDHLGSVIQDADASLVACSDADERATIKKNFLIGKLGLEDGPELDQAIEEVCHGLGEANRQKHRTTFYYLLVAVLKQEEAFLGEQGDKFWVKG